MFLPKAKLFVKKKRILLINLFNYIFLPLILFYFTANLWKNLVQQNILEKFSIIRNSLNEKWILFLSALIIGLLIKMVLDSLVWFINIKKIQYLSFTQSLQSCFLSQLLAFNTPSRAGGFIGKVYLLNSKNKPLGIFLTVFINFSQFFALFILGFISFNYFWYESILVLENLHLNDFNYLAGFYLILLFLIILYFFNEQWFTFVFKLKKLKLEHNLTYFKDFKFKDKLLIFIISLTKQLSVVALYIILITCFTKEFSFQYVYIICLYLLFIYYIPSIHIIDLYIRNSVGLYLMSNILEPSFIFLILSSVWVFNIFFPAFVGLIILIARKYFNFK